MRVLGLALRKGDYIVLRRFGKNKLVCVLQDAVASERLGWHVRMRPVTVVSDPWLALHVERIERRRGDKSYWYNTMFLALYTTFKPDWLHAITGKSQMYVFNDKKKAIEFIGSHPDLSLRTMLAVAVYRYRHRLPFLLVYALFYPTILPYGRYDRSDLR